MLKSRSVGGLWASLQYIGLLFFMTIEMLSCTSKVTGQAEATDMKQTDIVAGYGEKTFPETYNLQITLPIEESSFVSLLKKLGLYYQLCGERGTEVGIPLARQKTTVDLSRAEKCYEIDGDRDPLRHVGKVWRAFADRDGKIFYIENAFAYTGP